MFTDRRQGTNLAKTYPVRGHKSRAEDGVTAAGQGAYSFPLTVDSQMEVTHMVA